MNGFDRFQERTAIAANTFFWWYILPAGVAFYFLMSYWGWF